MSNNGTESGQIITDGQAIGLLGSALLLGGIFCPAALTLAFPPMHVSWAEGHNGPGRFMAIIAIGLAAGCLLRSRIVVNISALLATFLFALVLYLTYNPWSDVQRLLWGHGLLGTELITGVLSLEWGSWVIALGVLLALIASTCKLR